MNRGQRRAQWRASHIASGGRSTGGGTGPGSIPKSVAAKILAFAPRIGERGSLKLSVGELVLRGFDKRSASRVASAFESQMSELMRSGSLPGAWQQASHGASFRASPVRVRSLSDPVSLGERLARAVFASDPDHGSSAGAKPRSGA